MAEVEFFGQEGLPLKEALRRIQLALHENSRARSEGAWEKASLLNALGRVSAETVLANEAVPGFRASIMDGYALGQATIPKLGDQWHLVGRSSPGAAFEQKLKANEAIRILTGAPVPDGSDWVVPQELTQVCHQAEAENFRDIL
ncbi:MAG: molybdopterin molybdenumtransferase MoeA, partial [Prochlorococcaceae cyanobacterium ETNP2_MAG_10]|nr:molybdopterin molybdenumtransferase MoeA [Prochlorococcaceae cyanobacterium ETNP2_MAG_10]